MHRYEIDRMLQCLHSAFVADGVPKEGLRIQDVLVRLAILHLIRDKVENSLLVFVLHFIVSCLHFLCHSFTCPTLCPGLD